MKDLTCYFRACGSALIAVALFLCFLVPAQSSAQWVARAPMPTARAALTVGVIGTTLYAVGGGNDCCGANLTTVEAYDPATDTWTTKAGMEQPRDELRAAVINGLMYVVGGWHSPQELGTLEAYDPVTDSWTMKAPMPTARTTMGVGVINGILYALGGYDRYGVGKLTTVEAYDPATDSWTTKAPLPSPRNNMAVGVINGILYAAGGDDNSGQIATMVAYDPSTDTWTPRASMPTARGAAAAGVIGDRLYIVGGENPTGILNTVEAYDPASDQWSIVASMPTARNNFAAGVIGGVLYAVGGGNGNAPLAINEAFTPGPLVGTVAGSVLVGSTPLRGVTVTLSDSAAHPLPAFDPVETDSLGLFSFQGVPVGSYHVSIVDPLGYSVDGVQKSGNVVSGQTTTINFVLTPSVITSTARGVGYWDHQFDVAIRGRGHADETVQQLNAAIAAVQAHYTPNFPFFSDVTTFRAWDNALEASFCAFPRAKLLRNLAALVLNFGSLKIGQYTVVTKDARTAGDVLTYVSGIAADMSASGAQLRLAEDIAEDVNERELVGTGLVPAGNILYRGSGTGSITWGFGVPGSFVLMQNYPNPFNPSTTISYGLPSDAHVTLKVYDLLGREVRTIVNDDQKAGSYQVRFDAGGLASGMYIYRLQAGASAQSMKFTLMK